MTPVDFEFVSAVSLESSVTSAAAHAFAGT